MARGREADFTAEVRALARAFGWIEMHPYRSDRSTAGYPDLTMARAPRVVFAELKTDEKRSKLTPAQIVWANELKACSGVEYYLWRPRDLERIVEALK